MSSSLPRLMTALSRRAHAHAHVHAHSVMSPYRPQPPRLFRCYSGSEGTDEDRQPKKVVFMGTPEFAAPALRRLLGSHHEVVAVYTQPPRPAGRGRKLRKSPIHEIAEEHGIPVFTPKSLKSKASKGEFDGIEADVACVTAYGLLLPKAVLESKPFGCLNIHPSLLPRWRGAAPLPWAIISGDKTTGVCIMQLDEGMDTGPVLARHEQALLPGTTCGELHDQLAERGAEMMVDVIDRIHRLEATAQSPESAATHARKIQKEDGRLDFSRPAGELVNLVHGLSPVPGAFFELDGVSYKVLRADLVGSAEVEGEGGGPAGAGSGLDSGLVLDDALTIRCGDGDCIRPTLVQKAGKKAMDAKTFLNGNKITAGTKLPLFSAHAPEK